MSDFGAMSRADRLMNDEAWPHPSTACDDGGEHHWQPVSFVFEAQVLDKDGRVLIRQPDLRRGRVYCVCMACFAHTYAETEWAGFYLGGPPSLAVPDDDDPEDDVTPSQVTEDEAPG